MNLTVACPCLRPRSRDYALCPIQCLVPQQTYTKSKSVCRGRQQRPPPSRRYYKGVSQVKKKKKKGCRIPFWLPNPSLPRGLPEHIAYQLLEARPWHQFCKHISYVCLTILPCTPDNTSSLRFSRTVVSKIIVSLLQNRFRCGRILHN